jgi:hypothetical protein
MAKYVQFCMKGTLLAAATITFLALTACKSKPPAGESSTSAPASRPSTQTMNDSKRLSAGANKLMDAVNNPTTSFHFSFSGQENISEKYQRDKTQAPEVGPVGLEADISPDEMNMTETRGQTKKTTDAKKSDQMSWAMAHLTVLGPMTSANFSIALGSSVASSPGGDMVGTVPADKYAFDTATATGPQKMGLDMARSMLTSIKDTKGTAWIAKDSGELIKFNIDTDYQDKNGHAWKEHYEGQVTPK